MRDIVSVIIASLALFVSAITAWLTLFLKGTVRMTRPTVVFFGPDGGSGPDGTPKPKVFLRALLFSTAQRGRVVESMYVKLRRGESYQTFNIWVHGEVSIVRGSGLYVGRTGVAANHHFLLPADGTPYQFLAGEYTVQVYANLFGDSKPILLSEIKLMISESTAVQLRDSETGVYFDWGPEGQTYHPHVDRRPQPHLSDTVFTPERYPTAKRR